MKLSEPARLAIGAGVISLATVCLYRAILFVPAGGSQYPAGSDTLGHVFRAEYLRQSLAEGQPYPALFPDWYLGIELLRYYPPLPYYLMAGLTAVTSDPVSAANWFLAVCALAGGLAWLPYRRWIGWWPAVIGGVLFVFLPDNLRVALAEGNLPRALATALLPLAVYWLLRLLEPDGPRAAIIGLALCLAGVVLSHAMMAAIYAVGAVLLCLAAGLTRASPPRRLALAVASVSLGILLAGGWLLPSLTGGITELDAGAMTEALAAAPLANFFNPLVRTGNPEAIYIGTALLVAAAASVWGRRDRPEYSRALLLTGLAGVLITTPGLHRLIVSLPLHNLLWPLRFLGMASFMLLLAWVWRLKAWAAKSPGLAALAVAVVMIDNAGSLPLIHLRPPQPDTLPISQALSRSQGWREATLDLSRLGSEPSYFYAARAGREQVFGWAYQGARTARRVAALNYALEAGHIPYLLDRLSLYGVDDVVLLKGVVRAPQVAGGLAGSGFRLGYPGEVSDWWHRDGGPRAYAVNSPALGIGRSAQNLAYLFPQIVLGTAANVEAYSLEELTRYQTVILSGFGWTDRRAAEARIQQVAAAGVNVVVDLTGVPDDPLARIPRFLDVWGERIILGTDPVQVRGSGEAYGLSPLGSDGTLWYTHTPQGLEEVTLTFDYLGETAVALGCNHYGAGAVWFIGMNLPYHAAQTRDPEAIRLLTDLLGLPFEAPAAYAAVPVQAYRAGPTGYQFQVELDAPATLLVPVAYHEGMSVALDGGPARVSALEDLVAFPAPAGVHQVEIRLRPTGIHWLGWAVSGLALAGVAGVLIAEKRQ